MSMTKDVDHTFTNILFYWPPPIKKAENTLTWLLPNMGKMSPYCLLKMPLDQPYDLLYSFKDKEWLENGIMHYLQDL